MASTAGDAGGPMARGTKETAGGSGAELIEFLNHAMQRGLVPPQTGANYLVACKDILPFVSGEDWKRSDITSLDMGDVRHRLMATKGDRKLSRFNEHFLPAIEEFRKHLGLAPSTERTAIPADPVPTPHPDPRQNGDTPKHRTDPARRRSVPTGAPPPTAPATNPLPTPVPRRRTNGDAKGTSPGKRPGRVDSSQSKKSPPLLDKPEVLILNSSPVLPSFGVIPHLFPLREGILATLLLPADLTVMEARRLTAFIESLALPEDADRSNAGHPDTNGSVARTQSREKQVLP